METWTVLWMVFFFSFIPFLFFHLFISFSFSFLLLFRLVFRSFRRNVAWTMHVTSCWQDFVWGKIEISRCLGFQKYRLWKCFGSWRSNPSNWKRWSEFVCFVFLFFICFLCFFCFMFLFFFFFVFGDDDSNNVSIDWKISCLQLTYNWPPFNLLIITFQQIFF